MRARAAVGIAVATALLALAAGAPASAAARPRVTLTAPAELAVGVGTVVASISGLTTRGPVTIAFGQEATVQVDVRCTSRSKRQPLRCTGSAHHVFSTAGEQAVTVRVGRKVVAERVVSVDEAPIAGPWREQMLALANDIRAKAGVEPLRLCAPLNTSAQAHADDMIARGYYAHESPEGTKPWDRGASAGYGAYVWFGENIHTSVRTVEQAMEDWVASPGHYANLVRLEFTDAGFGYAISPEHDTRWVQNFGAQGVCG